MNDDPDHISCSKIFRIFLKLGLTSFGGPVAHLGYFRQEFVERRKWLTDADYADLVSLCQFLPGPASSQVGIGIGMSRLGFRGGLAAWAGFTLPSALLLILVAYGIGWTSAEEAQGLVSGLKLAAVAVVAQAVLGMVRTLCPDRPRRLFAVVAALLAFSVSGIGGQLLALACSACCGFWLSPEIEKPDQPFHIPAETRQQGMLCLVCFVLLLCVLPLIAQGYFFLDLFNSFFRTGALVFGGGHVVLPLLQAQIVDNGWLSQDLFLAGYGATQAVPGPLFTFAAYLGAVLGSGVMRWLGAVVCLIGIFLPSLLLLAGILPYWDKLRRNLAVRRVLMGVNAGVVGLLFAAFVDPVLTTSINGAFDVVMVGVCFWLLQSLKLSSWAVVLLCGGLYLTLF